MHSFGRVARRHERETWLQDPSNWRSLHHAEIEDQTTLRPKNPRRAWSPVSVASDWRQRYRQQGESDAPSTVGRGYRAAEHSLSDPFSSPPPSWSGSTTRSPERPVALSRSTSVVSFPATSMELTYKPPHGCGTPTILPSPDYPPTSTSSPQWDPHAMMSVSMPSVVPTPTSYSRPRHRGMSNPSPRSPSPGRTSLSRVEPEPPDPDSR